MKPHLAPFLAAEGREAQRQFRQAQRPMMARVRVFKKEARSPHLPGPMRRGSRSRWHTAATQAAAPAVPQLWPLAPPAAGARPLPSLNCPKADGWAHVWPQLWGPINTMPGCGADGQCPVRTTKEGNRGRLLRHGAARPQQPFTCPVCPWALGQIGLLRMVPPGPNVSSARPALVTGPGH